MGRAPPSARTLRYENKAVELTKNSPSLSRMFSFIGKRSVDYYYKIRKWKIFSQVDWDISEVISRRLQSPTKPQSLINLSTFRHLLSADILTFWKNRGRSIHSFGRLIAIYILWCSIAFCFCSDRVPVLGARST